jgi:hypothetical protein
LTPINFSMTNYLSILVLLFYDELEEEGLVTPILQTQECTFAYVKTNNLYIVSTTKKNANIGKMMREYFFYIHLDLIYI